MSFSRELSRDTLSTEVQGTRTIKEQLVSKLFHEQGRKPEYAGDTGAERGFVLVVHVETVETDTKEPGLVFKRFKAYKGIRNFVQSVPRFNRKTFETFQPDPTLLANMKEHVKTVNSLEGVA